MSKALHCLLCTAVLASAICLLVPAVAPSPTLAQTPQTEQSLGDTLKPDEPFIDRKVGTIAERYARFMSRVKKEHFNEYLATYCALVAALSGLVFGLLCYRLGDPMSPYRLMRRRSLQLALAVGGTIGISCAVMQVPPNTPGKVFLLLLATGAGAFAAVVTTWISFTAMRLRRNRAARREGRRITERMRHA